MPKYSWKEKSRSDWNTELDNASDLPVEYIQTGCLMRIAEATELMAQNYRQLMEDRDQYKRWYEQKKVEIERLQNEARTLRGVVTRFRNERDKLKNELFSGNLHKGTNQ